MQVRCIAMALAISAECLHVQTKSALPRFEVAAIKPCKGATAPGSCIPFDPDNQTSAGPGQPPWCGWFRASPQHDGEDTYGQTMDGLAFEFSGDLDRDVIDKTGIKGAFDIHLDEDPSAQPDPLAKISAALENLGLRLEPGRVPTPLLVIDHIERPSGN